MAVFCGTDIVYIQKMKEIIKNPELLKRFFHPSELKDKDIEHLSGILAAKEAFFKALNKFPRFNQIEIRFEKSGRPMIVASPEYQNYKKSDVSISHDHNYAIAVVIMER